MTKKYTQAQWIKLARKKHASRYDYSKVEYLGMSRPLEIICGIHGVFIQKAQSHVLGSGCPACGRVKTNRAQSAVRQLGLDTLIARFKSVHGARYDYSKVTSGTTKSKVKIICHEHGLFEQLANNHIRGSGCPSCGRNTAISKKTLDQETFVRRVEAVHGSKYDLTSVSYKKQNLPVTLFCRKHGLFKIRPDNLWSGAGCQACSRDVVGEGKRLGTKKFIELARGLHGEKYSYASTDYRTARDKVIVSCPTHGDFCPTPANHLSGSGCPVCARQRVGEMRSQSMTRAQDDVIDEFKAVHGNEYDYAEVEYRHSMKRVVIVCHAHGRFRQTPSAHIAGKGCPRCGNEAGAVKRTLSTQEIVERFKDLHGDRYDYSQVLYKKYNRKVVISCAEHGKFEQTAQAHLEGKGCPGCSQSSGEVRVARWLKSHGYVFLMEWRLPVSISASKNKYARYDFFIPDENLFIEFDGPHHFQPVRYAGMSEEDAEKVHKATVARDKQKDAWAAAHGFFVHRINWKEDVDSSLEKLLCS